MTTESLPSGRHEDSGERPGLDPHLRDGPGALQEERTQEERTQEERAQWEQRSRIVLTPVAAPSILGLVAFAAATFMVASNLAGWWGDEVTSPVIVAPFAFFFGGLGQLLAGMWAYRARDAVATAMHGAWGAFWLGWGLLVLLITIGALPPAVLSSQAFGFWFIGLTIITAFGTAAAAFDNFSLATTLGLLTVGAALLAAGLVGGLTVIVTAGAWVLVGSALAAFYTAGALMLAQGAGGRVVLPLGARSPGADTPGTRISHPIAYHGGMPEPRSASERRPGVTRATWVPESRTSE